MVLHLHQQKRARRNNCYIVVYYLNLDFGYLKNWAVRLALPFFKLNVMKICSKCHVEKTYNEFSKDKSKPLGQSSHCKSCHKIYKQQFKHRMKKYNFKHYHSKVLSHWIVYLLPNADNYVGHTNNPINRMYQHKNVNKRDIKGWIELARFNSKQEALLFEYEKRGQYRNTAPISKLDMSSTTTMKLKVTR